jgi:hypothetical protein
MSTDPYPEVTGDESGIVPPQSGRAPEWPKKLRTLSAAELDRLTIDGNGRFYWDGRLVNYEPPKEKSSDTREQSAMEVIDRAVHDLADQHTAETAEDNEPVRAAEVAVRHEEIRHDEPAAVDFDTIRPAPDALVPHEAAEIAVSTHVIRGSDVMRLKLSRWQSFGAILMVLGVIIGASGMAAYGFVAAHEWGCRAGLVQSYCGAAPVSRPGSRSDIPA